MEWDHVVVFVIFGILYTMCVFGLGYLWGTRDGKVD